MVQTDLLNAWHDQLRSQQGSFQLRTARRPGGVSMKTVPADRKSGGEAASRVGWSGFGSRRVASLHTAEVMMGSPGCRPRGAQACAGREPQSCFPCLVPSPSSCAPCESAPAAVLGRLAQVPFLFFQLGQSTEQAWDRDPGRKEPWSVWEKAATGEREGFLWVLAVKPQPHPGSP